MSAFKEWGFVMSCGCERSPTGDCMDWHDLSEDEYQVAPNGHNERNSDTANQTIRKFR